MRDNKRGTERVKNGTKYHNDTIYDRKQCVRLCCFLYLSFAFLFVLIHRNHINQ